MPATLTFRFDPAALPAGVSASGLLIAYLDPATKAWVPVPVTIDPAGTATATISHLSTWGLFGFDLDRWLVIVKALASGHITEFTTAISKAAAGCDESADGFTINNADASQMIEGCLASVSKGTASVEVTNLRAFALSVTSPRGYIGEQLLGPGQSVGFTVPNTDVPPATVTAMLSTEGLLLSALDIVMRMLPGWTTLKSSPDYWNVLLFVAAGVKADWDAAHICPDPRTCDIAQAAEKTFALLTDTHFLEAFLTALGEAGGTYHLPWLGALDAAAVKAILLGVNAGDLLVTGFTFLAQYVVNAQTSVTVNWTQLAAGPGEWITADRFADPSSDRIWFHLLALPDGKALAVGSDNLCAPGGPTLGDSRLTDVFDSATGRWVLVDPLNKERGAFIGVALADGRLLVTGGGNSFANGEASFSSTKIFDQTTGQWRSGGLLNHARTGGLG